MRLRLVPDRVVLTQLYTVLVESPRYLMQFWASVLLVTPIVLGQMAVGSMAAYAFSMLRFRGRDALFFLYIVTMLMPYQVTLVPNFIVVSVLGLVGRYSSIILPGIFGTFGVFLLRQFMAYIPLELAAAARGRRRRPLALFHEGGPAYGTSRAGIPCDPPVHGQLEYGGATAGVPP